MASSSPLMNTLGGLGMPAAFAALNVPNEKAEIAKSNITFRSFLITYHSYYFISR
jgi:hypothetical protein